ncbi:unnamed protein product [Meganyctiphanes norvegica]|uniref:Major facilitator superfamily domain-containing protein 12-like n=1 Tax=Meganyctiphanes norvegica TaxID=48144 RepID=A0AAV2QPI3_MEGNR
MAAEGKSMRWYTKLAYGVGHFYNDLCAAMWFTYLLIFYDKALQFTGVTAGAILLAGQLADGVATPLVGILCDMKFNNKYIIRYGRRKMWHVLGTVIVALCFPFVFNPCVGCSDASETQQTIYFCFFSIVHNIGWAFVQIAHLSLIPDLTSEKKQRTELTSIRYGFSVIANLGVYVMTFFFLGTGGSSCEPSNGNSTILNGNNGSTILYTSTDTTEDGCIEESSVGPEDASKFGAVALACTGIGVFMHIIFQIVVREEPYETTKDSQQKIDSSQCDPEKSPKKTMKKLDWFKELPLYQVAVLYMCTRLFVNLYQSYIVLYVQSYLHLPKVTVATIPFVMYIAGFIGSTIMKYINNKAGRKVTFSLGCLVGLIACIWLGLDQTTPFRTWGVYVVAAMLGVGGSTLLITSLSFTADLIGNNVEGSAFVYGFMSLVDKVSNGIIFMVIQTIGDHPENQEDGSSYYRLVMMYACGAPCLLGILVILTLINRHVGRNRDKCLINGIENPAINCNDTVM